MSGGGTFLVIAPSVSAVRRALFRAPGGARVLGRHDRQTIACRHTMTTHSYHRHWPVILSRLESAGLQVLESGEPDQKESPDQTTSLTEKST